MGLELALPPRPRQPLPCLPCFSSPTDVAPDVKEVAKEKMAQLKLRSGFGSRTVISEGPSKWPEQPSKYGGAQAARDLLDAMGVHRSADGGKRGTSQLNASASGEYGALEQRT